METNKKIDLKTLTREEWKKYLKMDKIAFSKLDSKYLFFTTLLTIFWFSFVLVSTFQIGSHFKTISNNINIISHYTNYTTYTNNMNTSAFIQNNKNQTITNSLILFEYNLNAITLFIVFFLVLIGMSYFVLNFSVRRISRYINPPIRTYKSLQKQLQLREQAIKLLKSKDYTEEEIEWYFSLRRAIFDLDKW
jgi:hypothetical protein